MTAAATPPLHVLRGILRHIKTKPSTETNNFNAATSATASSSSSTSVAQPQDSSQQSLQQHILSQYRASKSIPPPKATALRNVAYDYWMLKKDLVERARLHEMDAGADEKLSPRELSRRSAARAGLQLPKMDEGHVDS